jgi:hypothetical protein
VSPIIVVIAVVSPILAFFALRGALWLIGIILVAACEEQRDQWGVTGGKK